MSIYADEEEDLIMPGIERQVIFVTKDKKQFRTDTDALKHIENHILTEIDELFQDYIRDNPNSQLRRRDQMDIVTYLYTNRKRLQEILDFAD